MSAFLEKQKLLDWLDSEIQDLAINGYTHSAFDEAKQILDEITSGRFDWTGEGD